MDFLRDFRAGVSGNASESDWKPSGEKVLGLHELSLTPYEAVQSSSEDDSDHAGEWSLELEEEIFEPEPVSTSGQHSYAWTPPESTASTSWGSPSAPTRTHSSRSAWAPSSPPSPAGWGPQDVWSGPRVPVPARSRRRSPGTVAAAVLVVLALVAAGIVYVIRRQTPSYPSAWDPRVATIATFVESARGLTWKHPVSVTYLTPAQFEAKVGTSGSGSAGSGPTAQEQVEVARAFGLVWGNIDVSALPPVSGVGLPEAVYDDSTKAVYVYGQVVNPLVKADLAYALTSALEGEYFNLRRMTSPSADDELAASALVDGAAARVEQAYVRTMPAVQQRQFEQESQREAADAQRVAAVLPAFMADRAEFPGDFGSTLADALYAQGGNAELDEAFRNPPALDGEVVNPATYEPGIPTPKVDAPPVPAGDQPVAPAEGFGEVPLVEMLGYEIGFTSAWRAVAGWTGDQLVAFAVDGRTCAALSVLTDNAANAGALASAGSAWSEHVPGASVTEAGLTVQFRTCDPGPNWRPAAGADDPYRYLAARAGFIDNFIASSHLDADGATCVADEVLGKLGPQQLLRDRSLASLNNPSGQTLLATIRQALPVCGVTGSAATN